MTAAQIGGSQTFSIGSGGTAGTGTPNGGTGADGLIIVEEYFN